MTRFGFTGTQNGVDESRLLNILYGLNFKRGDVVITGGCIGVDSQIAHIVQIFFPFIKQEIIIPYKKEKVDKSVYDIGELFFMDTGTNYRDRNIQIVESSDRIIAFWTGDKIHSGTFMTMNIAKKKNKLSEVWLCRPNKDFERVEI